MKQNIWYSFLVLFIILSTQKSQAQWLKTMARLPDTGQNLSYTATFGEDNDFNINVPFFIDNGDGTVTDTITGLMWQKTDGGEMTYENAMVYVDTISLAGYNNWRLPSAKESFSILNQQLNNPALDAVFFTATGAEYWWTSVRQANDSLKIWVTNAGGGIGNHPKSETLSAGGAKKFHVRAVRDVNAPQLLTSHFTDNLDGTIHDNVTELTWQKISYFDSLTWENALTYADTCTLAGSIDWRLPNIKEMESINDESRINPSVDTSFFPNIGLKKYWSSTSLPNQTIRAWYLDTRFGITTYLTKTSRLNLLLVRGDGNPISSGVGAIQQPSNFDVYPNPFHDRIRIADKDKSRFVLTDLFGKVYFDGYELGNQDFSHLAAGSYLLRRMNEHPVTKMLIKN